MKQLQPAEKIKYFIYCRKSSEAEDKQIQSIETQERELKEFVEKNNLDVVDVLSESQSAHTIGRPVYKQMTERIKRGEAQGILVLFPNRLSRNPIDGATIIHLIDLGKLIHVRTPSHIYSSTSTEKMMLALEFMLSKKDSDDKSEHVKTGLRTRYIKGYPNGVAPIGFRNDMSREKGDRGWVVDHEQFGLVRQLLEMFQTGKYSVRKLADVANNEMGLRTTLHKKQGGKKLVISYVADTILKNPVFAGFFFTADGARHELHPSMPRMITEDQYWYNQKILQSRGRPRASKNIGTFAYIGPTKCGGCGGSVTAEHKYQVICDCGLKFAYQNKTNCPSCCILIEKMDDPTYLHYIFYHCTKKKNPSCGEGSVQEKYIDGYLANYFKEKLRISPALHAWCLENINEPNISKKNNELDQKSSLEKTLKQKEKENREIALMRARGLLNDDDFMGLKGPLDSEIQTLKSSLGKLDKVDPQRIVKAHRAFDLALGIAEVFENGTAEEKKSALSEIGSNLTLKEKKLNVINTNLYSTIMNGLLSARTKNDRFEPENIVDVSSSNLVFKDVCPTLLPLLVTFRTFDWNNFKSELQFSGIMDLFSNP